LRIGLEAIHVVISWQTTCLHFVQQALRLWEAEFKGDRLINLVEKNLSASQHSGCVMVIASCF
jgi:hypothetical protein